MRNEVIYSSWRKNTQSYGSCIPSCIGVDLNRNHAFNWGYDEIGSSLDPCDNTYRGPSAVSEPETQALQAFVRQLFPDQRGPADEGAAPDNAEGLLISLHSYSNLVL